jgi:O-antigen/teichoic acid export membrane protein
MKITDDFLEKFENALQLDIRYYIKNITYLISTDIASAFFGLLLSVSFAYFVSKEIYGQYNYIISIFMFLAILSLPGINSGITIAVKKGFEGNFPYGFSVRFRWSFLGTLILIAVGLYYYFSGSIILGKAFIATSLIFPLFHSSDALFGFLPGKERFGLMAKYRVSIQAISSLIAIVFIYFIPDLLYIVVAYLFSNALIKFYFVIKSKNLVRSRNIDTELVRYGKKLTLMQTLPFIAMYIDRILIANFIGFEELAIYSFAIVLPEHIRGFMRNLQHILLPKLSVADNVVIKKNMVRYFLILLAISVLVTVTYIIFAPFVYDILFPQYDKSVYYSRVFAITLIFFPTILFPKTFEAKKMEKELWIVNTLTFVRTSLFLILIPVYGIMGAVTARLLSKFIGSFFQWMLFRYSVK